MAVLPGTSLPLARCGSCGLIHQRNWEGGFASDQYDYYEERLDWSEQRVYPALNDERLAETLDGLRAQVEGTRLLDVGCGNGSLVRAANREGWRALGIDLSPSAIRLGRRFGVVCEQLDFFDASLDQERFDLIVMSELIEHVPAPVRFLERGRELLAPGGAVYLTTPNFASLGRRVLGPAWGPIHPQHLSYFTPRTLRRSAARAGLQVASLRTDNLSVAAVRGLLGRGSGPAERSRVAAQDLRQTVHRSPILVLVKRTVNAFLTLFELGETIKAVMRPATATHART